MAMDRVDLFVLTTQLRRQFSRHGAILALCAEAERLALEAAKPIAVTGAPAVESGAERPKRDRSEYMRTYMRERRARPRT